MFWDERVGCFCGMVTTSSLWTCVFMILIVCQMLLNGKSQMYSVYNIYIYVIYYILYIFWNKYHHGFRLQELLPLKFTPQNPPPRTSSGPQQPQEEETVFTSSPVDCPETMWNKLTWPWVKKMPTSTGTTGSWVWFFLLPNRFFFGGYPVFLTHSHLTDSTLDRCYRTLSCRWCAPWRTPIHSEELPGRTAVCKYDPGVQSFKHVMTGNTAVFLWWIGGCFGATAIIEDLWTDCNML